MNREIFINIMMLLSIAASAWTMTMVIKALNDRIDAFRERKHKS
jgi:hypothetical protein